LFDQSSFPGKQRRRAAPQRRRAATPPFCMLGGIRVKPPGVRMPLSTSCYNSMILGSIPCSMQC
jgi:hypothetical protein